MDGTITFWVHRVDLAYHIREGVASAATAVGFAGEGFPLKGVAYSTYAGIKLTELLRVSPPPDDAVRVALSGYADSFRALTSALQSSQPEENGKAVTTGVMAEKLNELNAHVVEAMSADRKRAAPQ